MTLLDRAKVAAEKARVAAEKGMQQGQAKLDAIQTKRKADALLHKLGSAYYAEQRHGGLREPVDAALAALDAHAAEHGPVDTSTDQST